MFQGGSSSKKSPRLALCEPDLELPREALVQPCEWPSCYFMTQASFKEEFYMYMNNVGLTDFVPDKYLQYYDLTNSFVRKFKYFVQRNSHAVIFNLNENTFCMDLEEFNEACKIPQWATYMLYLISVKTHFGWTLKSLMKHAKFHNGALTLNLVNLTALSSLLASLEVKLEA